MKSLVGLGVSLYACLFVLTACAPPAEQGQSNPAAPPAAPPAPPPTGEQVAAAPPAAPPVAPAPAQPAEAPAANPLAALSPLAAYEDLDRRINAVLSKITDGPSANAAADELAPLTAEMKLKLRPYIVAFATMSDAEQLAYVQRQTEEAISQKSAGVQVDHRQLIELAREPGNERFKASLQAMFQTMIDEGTTGMRRSMSQKLERLNRP
ncbi:MAG TPA: hypothetical protein VFV87_03355, partial [Pirellulaceae bacterium]|nr:hypothetical protein [Pirellulaceae bacterium]